MQKKTLIIVFNNFQADNRVERQAQELIGLGHEVSVLALQDGKSLFYEKRDGYKIFRFPLASWNSPSDIEKITSLAISNKLHTELQQKFYPSKPSPNPTTTCKKENNPITPNILQTDTRQPSKENLIKRKLETAWSLRKNPGVIAQTIKSHIKKLIRRVKRALIRLLRKLKSKNMLLLPFKSSIASLEFKKRKLTYEKLSQISLYAAKELSPGLVLANDFNGLLAAERIYDHYEIPFIYDSHELWTERNRPLDFISKAEKNWEKKSEARGMGKSSHNITVCQSIAEYLAKQYKIQVPSVIRNTPNKSTLVRSEERDLKKIFGLSEDDFLLIYIGKVTFNRGVEDILDSLTLTNKNVHFATLGYFDPRFKIEFDERVKRNKVESRIFHHPAVPSSEVPSYASSADISLATVRQACLSYYFALPNKMFESLHAQLPIIATNSPEMERIINTFNCGITYKDCDVNDLYKGISTLQTNLKLRNQLKKGSINGSQSLIWSKEKIKFHAIINKTIKDTQNKQRNFKESTS